MVEERSIVKQKGKKKNSKPVWLRAGQDIWRSCDSTLPENTEAGTDVCGLYTESPNAQSFQHLELENFYFACVNPSENYWSCFTRAQNLLNKGPWPIRPESLRDPHFGLVDDHLESNFGPWRE